MIAACKSRSTKRKRRRARRTKAEMATLCDALYGFAAERKPATCRHLFYCMTTAGHVAKTEGECKNTVNRLLVKMRRQGRIPYSWLTDNTRWRMKPDSFSSLADALAATQDSYRRALWDNQDTYVEVWTEKDAISGILWPVTSRWDVPLMTARGYASLSFLYSVAEDLKEIDKPAYLYYFGDHDPSGRDARRCVEKTIRELAPGVEVHFELVAVTPEQIEELGLPTRPTKTTDTRARVFKGESVEVDAIAPAVLRALCDECITRHIDPIRLRQLRAVEDAEKVTLAEFMAGFAKEP